MTPKQEAALRLALDCVSTLANARDWVGCTPNERWDEDEMYAELCNATICLKKSLSIIQEALAEQPHCDDCGGFDPECPLAQPAQQQKPWVDLTDEEIDDIYQGAGKNDLKRAREVLAAFKEKNT